MAENVVGGLVVRIMERADLEQARKLHNDDTTLLKLHDIRHVSEIEQDDWYESISRSRTSRRYSVIELESGDLVGIFRLDQLDLQNRCALVGLDIVNKYRGRGYAKTVYDYFFKYLFNEMGLNRLGLVVLDGNDVALNLYRSVGFVEEGRLRKAIFRGGEFRDLLQFGLLRDEYVTILSRHR